MPIIAKASGTSFAPASEGPHAAVCVDVVDLGMVPSKFTDKNGKPKSQHKILIVWQIDEDRDDGKPYQVANRYTLSLHEKATLRDHLEAWRGKPFTELECEGFDVETLISAPALLNLIHDKKGLYANVASLMRLPKNMQAPKPRDYVRMCDRKTENSAVPPGFEDGPDTFPSDDDGSHYGQDVPF